MNDKKTGYPSIDKTHLQGIDPTKLRQQRKVFLSWFGLFNLISAKTMNQLALIEGNRFYTKKNLRDDVLVMAKALLLNGLARGDKLAIVTPNSYKGIVLAFAANAIGIGVAYLNPLDSLERIIEELKFYEADAVAIHETDKKRTKMFKKHVPSLKVVINTTGSNCPDERSYVSYEVAKYEAESSKKNVWPKILRNLFNKNDLLYLQTSGSTSGVPKKITFGNDSVFAYLMSVKDSTGIRTNGADVKRALCVLPYRLPYGWMGIFSNIFGGNPVDLATSWEPEDIAKWHEREITHGYLTPAIIQSVMDNTPEDADLSSWKVIYSAGFATSEGLIRRAKEFFARHNAPNINIYPSYGMGEMLCAGTVMNRVGYKPGTTGVFYYGLETLIVDDEMKEVKYDETGLLLMRGATMFRGYYKDEEATKKMFVEVRGKKWLRTGDFGSLAEDGRWSPKGREKRFFQPFGATDKVNCATIEEALGNVSIVKKCGVAICSPDDKYDEGWAFVVLENGVEKSEGIKESIYSQLRNKLLDYQLPAKIKFLDALPMLESGKPDYQALEKMC